VNDFRIGDVGLELIKHFESLALVAYLCPAGVWTIGWGRTQGVKPGDTCTRAEADAWLLEDVEDFERAVQAMVRVPLTQNQFDALVCFTYNVGTGNLSRSTLLRMLNGGDYAGAAGQFPRWNKGGGKVLPGLVRRRAAEQNLFLTP
jgi:lysozyme